MLTPPLPDPPPAANQAVADGSAPGPPTPPPGEYTAFGERHGVEAGPAGGPAGEGGRKTPWRAVAPAPLRDTRRKDGEGGGGGDGRLPSPGSPRRCTGQGDCGCHIPVRRQPPPDSRSPAHRSHPDALHGHLEARVVAEPGFGPPNAKLTRDGDAGTASETRAMGGPQRPRRCAGAHRTFRWCSQQQRQSQ